MLYMLTYMSEAFEAMLTKGRKEGREGGREEGRKEGRKEKAGGHDMWLTQ